jgi:hypothetical protein
MSFLTNLAKFQLISKTPFLSCYKEYSFIPILHDTDKVPEKPLYFQKEIGCADDMVYHTVREMNAKDNKNLIEYRALGFQNRLEQVMMTAARNPMSENAKYIIFTCNALGAKYKNRVIGVFENVYENADPKLTIEYEIYRTEGRE